MDGKYIEGKVGSQIPMHEHIFGSEPLYTWIVTYSVSPPPVVCLGNTLPAKIKYHAIYAAIALQRLGGEAS